MARYEYLELPRFDGKERLFEDGKKLTFMEHLSHYANEGWRVHSVFASTSGGGGSFLFETDVDTDIYYLLEREAQK